MMMVNVVITTIVKRMVSKSAMPRCRKKFLCLSIRFGRFLNAVIRELTPLEAKKMDNRKMKETDLPIGLSSVICFIESVIKK